MSEPLIRSISDTARWVAYHRATESDRPDAIFHDAYARRLAGERGALIARKLRENAWAIAIRTYLFDSAIRRLLSREAVDMVVNLAAGLDSRPYRLELPPSLQWVEVDLPEIVDPKQEVLAGEKPRCQLEVITQHLGDEAQRRALFSQLNQRAHNILAICEGLLSYLDEDRVTSLAADLHAQPRFHYWLVEIVSPRVLKFITRKWAHYFKAANAPMAFAPADWRKFYRDRGWELVEFEEMAQTAHRMKREPGMMKVFRLLGQAFPGWGQKQAKLWESGVALLRRA
jgi:methyltransferase (TIGR00027 family)